MSSDYEDRSTNEQNADQVDEHEHRAATLTDLSRETPDVAESDGGTGGRENETRAASPTCHVQVMPCAMPSRWFMGLVE